jgi:peptidoglycan-N-acetylglucosamine deacetylase
MACARGEPPSEKDSPRTSNLVGERSALPVAKRPAELGATKLAGDNVPTPVRQSEPQSSNLPTTLPKIIDEERAWLLAEGPRPSEDSGRRVVTFTFDDGPAPRTTDAVLRVLKKYQVQATFFLIGEYLDRNSQRGERMRRAAAHIAAEGHLIGNHTYDHKNLGALDQDGVDTEITRAQESIAGVVGKKPTLFRPPFGAMSNHVQNTLNAEGLVPVLWSVEAGDMNERDAKAIASEIRGRIMYADGGLVLLHDVSWATVRALDDVLRWLKSNRYDPAKPKQLGYEVVGLSQYLAEAEARPYPETSREELIRHRKERAERQSDHSRRERSTGQPRGSRGSTRTK